MTSAGKLDGIAEEIDDDLAKTARISDNANRQLRS